MDFNTEKLKRTAAIAVGAFLIAGVGYGYASYTKTPRMVAVSQTGCGIPAGAISFSVPLQTIGRGAPSIAASYGPLELPASNALRLAFDPTADGKGREVEMRDGTLYLPVAFGRQSRLPERIRVTCRDGVIANVRYDGSGRSTTNFNVVHQ